MPKYNFKICLKCTSPFVFLAQALSCSGSFCLHNANTKSSRRRDSRKEWKKFYSNRKSCNWVIFVLLASSSPISVIVYLLKTWLMLQWRSGTNRWLNFIDWGKCRHFLTHNFRKKSEFWWNIVIKTLNCFQVSRVNLFSVEVLLFIIERVNRD